MFLNEFDVLSNKLKQNSTQYKPFYNFRINQLLEYLMQLFTWEGLPESIPAHEIDLYLYLYGRCGVNKSASGDLLAVAIQQSDNTDYIDRFKKYTWATPLHNGQQYIDVNGVVISNTFLRNSAYPLIHATAAKLAHADVTYICNLVNGRDTVAIKAASNKFANDALNYQNKKYQGAPSFIVDMGFSTIETEDMKTQNSMNVREIIDTQQLILSEFWESIGVLKMSEKRERMTAAETTPNTALLKLNISNMYNCRKAGADAINKMFGTSVSVKCNVDIDGDQVIDTEGLNPEEGGNDIETA